MEKGEIRELQASTERPESQALEVHQVRKEEMENLELREQLVMWERLVKTDPQEKLDSMVSQEAQE